jgi:hypothetical protein
MALCLFSFILGPLELASKVSSAADGDMRAATSTSFAAHLAAFSTNLLLKPVLIFRPEYQYSRPAELLADLRNELMHHRALVTLLGCFVALQISPMVFKLDPDITGEGAFYRVHMFQRKVACVSRVAFYDSSGVKFSETAEYPRDVPGRLACNPVAFLALANQWCSTSTYEDRIFHRFKVEVDVRFRNSKEVSPLIRFEGGCGELPRYRVFGSNSKWIVPKSERAHYELIPQNLDTMTGTS